MKKKICFVPHCHWDREWYFSKETSDVLLHNNIKEMIANITSQRFFYDGQWGLLDDYVQDNPQDLKKIQVLLKDKKISCGPFYSQPDLLNSQAETIIRNLELGKNVAKGVFEVSNNQTAYLPDSFGFSQNLLNIFKYTKIKNFVFWRGLPEEETEKHVLFSWKNPNYQVKALCLRNGYYYLGSHFPYNGKKGLYPEKWNPVRYADLIKKVIAENQGFAEEHIFPLGGDQAPFTHNQQSFLQQVQKHLPEYEVVVEPNYERFFAKVNTQKLPEYKGDLLEPFTGKIHRTISSSRYDIKQLFRQAEDKLYYLLEPLEVFYNNIDTNYEFESFKRRRILKPLMIAQAHDSLGACNTDTTNAFQLNRLKLVHENIDSQVDLILKKLLQENSYLGEEIMVFNPAPFRNSVFTKMTFYSGRHKKININQKRFFVHTINSQNVSLGAKPVYKLEVFVYFENLPPLSWEVLEEKLVSVENSKALSKTRPNETDVKIKNHKIYFKKVAVSFEAVEELGDSYDSSPGKKIHFEQVHHLTNRITVGKGKNIFCMLTTLTTNQQKHTFEWNIFQKDKDFEVKLETHNKFKNTKISLVFENVNTQNLFYSQNLALKKAQNKEIPSNWKARLHECPVNVFVNDGIITSNNFSILTFGNNEMFVEEQKVKITLFRTYDLVTKNHLPWRDSTSGLSWKEDSWDSQLQKKLDFRFVFSFGKNIHYLFNKHKLRPYVYKNQNANFTANKMTKFVVNNILNKHKKQLTLPQINGKNALISAFHLKNKKLKVRLANVFPQRETIQEVKNGKKTENIVVPKQTIVSYEAKTK